MADVSDDFNRSDEDPLGNGNWDGSGIYELEIVSNVCEGKTNNKWCLSVWTADSFTDDQYAQLDVNNPPFTNAAVGPLVRMDTSGNGYGSSYSASYPRIVKYVTGTYNELSAGDYSFCSPGSVLLLDVTSTTLTLTKDAANDHTDTDSTYSSGVVGASVYDNTADSIDDFSGGPVAAAGGLSIPVAMHHYTKNISGGR